MNSLYFRFTEQPNPELFNAGWIELPPTLNPFVLSRSVWRGNQVSRQMDRCAVIRFDLHSEVWTMRNGAPNRIVILSNGTDRFDLRTSMSVDIGPGDWSGALTDAFEFELTHKRPVGPITVHAEPDPAHSALDAPTSPRNSAVRARTYLERHRHKRLALAYMWRQHLGPTSDVAGDLSTAEVGKAFNESAKTIGTWREDLALYVYHKRGHQNQIRDFVITHRILTLDDVREADAWVDDQNRPRPTVFPQRSPTQDFVRGSGQSHLQDTNELPAPRPKPYTDQSTTRRPPRRT